MKVEHLVVTTSVLISEIKSLDPITVITRDISPGVATVIVACHGDAWVAWWGNTGKRTARDMLLTSPLDYLVSSFWTRHEAPDVSREIYMTRIFEAIREAIKLNEVIG